MRFIRACIATASGEELAENDVDNFYEEFLKKLSIDTSIPWSETHKKENADTMSVFELIHKSG